ncbi:MAG: hypothetical protein U5K43_04170 [Halofilum sp. (in: g-proteobacteria)]|nr:hypothetical protein [Halofilum sp. (in: g-proteobacteria)]
MGLDTLDLPRLGHRIAGDIRARLRDRLVAQGGGETLLDPANLKSAHAIDRHAADAARRALRGESCRIHIEGEASGGAGDASFCVYIDPVDGSLNWDRGIGDPAFVLAAGRGASITTLDGLELAYVEGLRSGDRYYTLGDEAVYWNALTQTRVTLACRGPGRLDAATGYLRCGYGGARAQLEHTLALFLAARDLRAVDNAGTELAEIARNAADFMVEARGISDGYNLLAWPILRAAGGVLLDLDGAELAPQPFAPAAASDFVAANDPRLAAAVVAAMDAGRARSRACLDALAGHGDRPGGAGDG